MLKSIVVAAGDVLASAYGSLVAPTSAFSAKDVRKLRNQTYSVTRPRIYGYGFIRRAHAENLRPDSCLGTVIDVVLSPSFTGNDNDIVELSMVPPSLRGPWLSFRIDGRILRLF